jgi:hypothetical protein
MHKHDVFHSWDPSPRLRSLAKQRFNAAFEKYDPSQLAKDVLAGREAFFSSGASMRRIRNCLIRSFGHHLTIGELIEMVRASHAQANAVFGPLGVAQSLGVRSFAELQQVLKDADESE